MIQIGQSTATILSQEKQHALELSVHVSIKQTTLNLHCFQSQLKYSKDVCCFHQVYYSIQWSTIKLNLAVKAMKLATIHQMIGFKFTHIGRFSMYALFYKFGKVVKLFQSLSCSEIATAIYQGKFQFFLPLSII